MTDQLTCNGCDALAETKDPNQIGVPQYVCVRYPPQVAFIPGPQGTAVVSAYPPVGPNLRACLEHTAYEEYDDAVESGVLDR